jgi:hypothetical protein
MYGQKHRVDIMTFQVDCIAKVINIEKFWKTISSNLWQGLSKKKENKNEKFKK